MASLLFLLFFYTSANGNTLNRFELNDGSVIQGEILSYSKGVYRINSNILGTVTLPENKIRSIQPVGKPDASTLSSVARENPSPETVKIDQVQQQMLGDPETVQLIQKLQNDPSVQKILQDRELMEAITQGNLNRVGADPKIKELMKNESVEKIIENTQ